MTLIQKLVWQTLPGPSIAVSQCRMNPITGDIVVWNNSARQWQGWVPATGWLSVGSWPSGVNGTNGLYAVSQIVNGKAASFVANSGNGCTLILNAGGVGSFGTFNTRYFNMPSYLYSSSMDTTAGAASIQNQLFMNRYYPNLYFAPVTCDLSNGVIVGFDIVTGTPQIVILTDLTLLPAYGQNSLFKEVVSASSPPLNAAQGVSPGALAYMFTTGAGSYSGAFVDFYNMNLVNGTFGGTLNTVAGSSNGSTVTGQYGIKQPNQPASSRYFPTSSHSFSAGMPVSNYSASDIARNIVALGIVSNEVRSVAFRGTNATVYAVTSGGVVTSFVYLPYPNGIIGLPISMAPPSGMDTTVGQFFYGVWGGNLYVLDLTGNFYVLALQSQEFELSSTGNWSRPWTE